MGTQKDRKGQMTWPVYRKGLCNVAFNGNLSLEMVFKEKKSGVTNQVMKDAQYFPQILYSLKKMEIPTN